MKCKHKFTKDEEYSRKRWGSFEPWACPKCGGCSYKIIDKLAAAESRLADLTTERDEWRNSRHAYEARLFEMLHPALDYPDDKSVVDMVADVLARLSRVPGGQEGTQT